MSACNMHFTFFFLILQLQHVFCLYEDQMGLFDWKQDYVGKVENLFWDQSSAATGKRLFVSTEKHVVASIHAHNGSLAWRRVFEETERGRVDSLLYQSNTLISVLSGGDFIRSWQMGTSLLLWEVKLGTENNIRSTSIFTSNEKADSFLVATSNGLYNIKTNDGKKLWQTNLPKSNTINRWLLAVTEDDNYMAVGLSRNAEVTIAAINQDGSLVSERSVHAPWVSDDVSCMILKGSQLVCYVPSKQAIQHVGLRDGNSFITTSLRDLGFEATTETSLETPLNGITGFEKECILRISKDHLVVLTIDGGKVKIIKDMPKVSAAEIVEHEDKTLIVALQKSTTEPMVTISGYDIKTGQENTDLSQKIPFANSHGLPKKVSSLIFTKRRDSRIGCKIAILSEDYALQVVQKAGRVSWRREEALAYILALEMVDLPVSENQAKFEDEFGSNDEIFVMFIKRLRAQLSQLKLFVIKMVEKLQGLRHPAPTLSDEDIDQEEDEIEEEEDMIRDEFNLHKVIVAVTKPGKIFGIRSHTGKIVWQHYLSDLVPYNKFGELSMLLLIQRTTAHFPHPPQCAIIGKNKRTGNGMLFTINPTLGTVIKDTPSHGLDLGYKVLQVSLLNHIDSNFLKGILLMDNDKKIHLYPESIGPVIQTSLPKLYLHLTDLNTNIITGYRIINTKNQGLMAEAVWNVNLNKNQQTIRQVVGKRAIEHVHSQGRVLGDRSVLYKYLNPNLLAVVAEGEEPPSPGNHKGFFNIYLIDGVTGHIVFHVNHKRAKGPINTVHSENWLVYSYFSEKHRRHELAVLEMYEGKEQSNSTAFSSLSPPPQPLVLRQSYIFSSPLYSMSTTVTEKGLTNKNIIIALKFGGLLSLPKALLDPRRPAMPSQESIFNNLLSREEGVIPYIPEIPIHNEAILNYNKTLYRVDGIYTGPAGLESTSLIFTYGLDLFFTRVMPSKMFDVLKEDFDYALIGSILCIMILVSFLTQKLAAKRALSRAWK
ncbi:hypothetical protein LOTGIDRAFT_238345, partial [Lottia gigantea]